MALKMLQRAVYCRGFSSHYLTMRLHDTDLQCSDRDSKEFSRYHRVDQVQLWVVETYKSKLSPLLGAFDDFIQSSCLSDESKQSGEWRLCLPFSPSYDYGVSPSPHCDGQDENIPWQTLCSRDYLPYTFGSHPQI